MAEELDVNRASIVDRNHLRLDVRDHSASPSVFIDIRSIPVIMTEFWPSRAGKCGISL